ncbi:MAG: SH3 domain-containing protein [Gloeomargarita sp. SKYG116]|nr:SH3 domain-containing protein [Gloeomargarita sp. SKYG116]MDW8400332.1 SH3 domain-containing protein [Gloeomargarita sp. SKYGB_i_bin116]
MASRLRESTSPWTWVASFVLATTLPMTASFILVRLGLQHWYQAMAPRLETPTLQPNPPQTDVIPAGQPVQVTEPQGLLVRAQPDVNSRVVGTVAYQQTVERLEVSPDRQWEQVRLPAQQVIGWVRAGYLQPLATHTPAATPNLWVTAKDGLILRREPSTSAPVVTGLAYAQELILLTYNADQSWAQVQVPATGTIGWVKAEYTRATPPTEREGRQVAVNAATGLLLREAPNGTPLTTLPDKETLLVLDASADGQWLKVMVVRTQQEGWVKSDYTRPL